MCSTWLELVLSMATGVVVLPILYYCEAPALNSCCSHSLGCRCSCCWRRCSARSADAELGVYCLHISVGFFVSGVAAFAAVSMRKAERLLPLLQQLRIVTMVVVGSVNIWRQTDKELITQRILMQIKVRSYATEAQASSQRQHKRRATQAHSTNTNTSIALRVDVRVRAQVRDVVHQLGPAVSLTFSQDIQRALPTVRLLAFAGIALPAVFRFSMQCYPRFFSLLLRPFLVSSALPGITLQVCRMCCILCLVQCHKRPLDLSFVSFCVVFVLRAKIGAPLELSFLVCAPRLHVCFALHGTFCLRLMLRCCVFFEKCLELTHACGLSCPCRSCWMLTQSDCCGCVGSLHLCR